MKKILLSLLVISLCSFSFAQGTQVVGSPIYYGASGVNIGGLSNTNLAVRHINGKSTNSILEDNLYLNYNTGKIVQIGSAGILANMIVHGKIGIGNPSPSYDLDVSGIGRFTSNVLAQSSLYLGNTNAARLSSNGSFGFDINYGIAGGSFNYYTGTINRFKIDSNGKVGIGTTSPNGNLEVVHSGDAQLQITSNGNFGNVELSFLNSHDNHGFKQTLWNGGDQLHFNFGPEFNGGVNATTNIMTLHGNGNIGIGTGTNSPSAKLEVNGTTTVTGLTTLNNSVTISSNGYTTINNPVAINNNLTFGQTTSLPASAISHHTNGYLYMKGGASGTIIGDDGGVNTIRLTDGTNGYFMVETGNGTEKFRVNAAGDVGIGTTTPGEKLEVNGNALIDGELYSKKVKVSVNPGNWPDYVFAKSYQLTPLNELEEFIKFNHHLPEVPSAKEVEKEGLDLGDMDATLLKKVEELTLYMIEMKKEIEVLKKENKKLSDEVKKVKK